VADRPGYLGQPGEPSGQPRGAFGGFQQQPGFDPRFGQAGGAGQFAAPAAPTAVGIPAARKGPSKHTRTLIGGAAIVVVLVVVGVLFVTKAFGVFGGGPSDPGCKAYANTALGAYNKTIDDLNAQASQSTLSADMTAAITDLASASAQAQSASAKSALSALLSQFKVVRADVAAGSVPPATVKKLNADSAAADHAC
jgi:hypothetical protein